MDPVKPLDKILIVDDDEDTLQLLSDIIRSEGYEVITAGDGRKALKEVRAHSPDVVLLDIKLPEMDGMKVLEKIKKIDKNLIVIMLTAYGETKRVVQAMKLGAFDYITKPFDNEEIMLNIKKALESRSLRIEVEDLRRRLEEKTTITQFVGEGPHIKAILNQVKIVAPTNLTVIIQGESGTGKELIARMIHQESPRHDKPFITVDCGTLPENLVESELFGYERGAFTGADKRRGGKFEAANEGILFLDEITNLPQSLQAKLLRVIQERKVQHLGGTKEIKIDVRIIAATNTFLSNEIKKGRFRDDLYHRLNEFNINLPLLRERQEDIPLLARYFLEEANQEFNKKIEGISGEAMKSLLNYSWPGNVRELRNKIRKAVLLTDSNYIREINLSMDAASNSEIVIPPRPPLEKGGEGGFEGISLREITKRTTEKVEREIIKEALAEAKNNKVKAAKILKIDRMTLYSKIKSLGL
ncbi:MAG: DNA-binding response regulator [Nitrospirae bacterium CG11_big_fil_rev_8_21_14_0_20_41_14]|nr:MAG: DNA-binding response regulator [Nitrospirae bacterium CG11_big_fil_rev_8_21_14_0_20_41_14]